MVAIALIIGYVALIIFFAVILGSLMGLIPQNKLPIQTALFITAVIIMLIGWVGSIIPGSDIVAFGPSELSGKIVIHPITALVSGFFVAGALEAAGAFEAMGDLLDRMKETPFGLVGTAMFLVNIPTLIAMPCGRILAAALMPAAILFGLRLAKDMGDARVTGAIVFAFIVNAAASCGPSPLGGIGTIGEGMGRFPIGSLVAPQATGIILATSVCAVIVKYITPLFPGGESDE
ncbi:MAG: hypothetical protein SVM80_11535 [Halobacteriota archaeon]|nr:hypothetical protein [Halobacteriota archaeon]